MNLSSRPHLFSNRNSGQLKKFEPSQRNQAENRPRRSRYSSYHYVPRTTRRFGLGYQSDAKSFVSNWQTYSTPARIFIARNQRKLVARSRDIIMNNDYDRSFMRMVIQNVVGEDGISFQASARNTSPVCDLPLPLPLQGRSECL